MQFSRISRHWSVIERSERQFVLKNALGERSFKPGWWRVVLKAKNPEALRLIQARARLQVKQNRNFQSASLHAESSNKLALVFYRHTPLSQATLSVSPNTATQDDLDGAQFELSVKAVTSARAWQVMLGVVSRLYEMRGEGRSRIYALTRARQKRAGLTKSLEKLVEAYQPLLCYQLVSSNPYEYWQSQYETSARAAEGSGHSATSERSESCRESANVNKDSVATAPEAPQTPFVIIEAQGRMHSHLDHRGDPHGPHGNNLATMLEALNYPNATVTSARDLQDSTTAMAADAWYILMHPLDKLADRALHRVHEYIVEHPEALVIYCDHDVIGHEGERFNPNFKPDWNYELALSQNYIGPAVWVKGTLLRQIDTLPSYSHLFNLAWLKQLRLGSQRCSQQHTNSLSSDPSKLPLSQVIHHISEVLFHQREANTQITPPDDEVITALQAIHPETEPVATAVKGIFHVRFPLPEPAPLVSILVPTRDARLLTQTCIDSVLNKTTYPNYEILILDNQSEQPETLAWFNDISHHPKVRVLPYNAPFNYAAINNFGVEHAHGEYICLLNNDTEVDNGDWLSNMMRHATRDEIGCVGAKLYFFDDTIQHAGVVLGLWGLAGHGHKYYDREDTGYQYRLVSEQSYSAVTAACLVVRKSIYEQVGGLNEDQLKVAFNDVDLCLKVQEAGFRNLWTPYAELYHYESKTRGKEDTPEKKARERVEISYMRAAWPEIIANDPAYNVHLTRVREDFGLNMVPNPSRSESQSYRQSTW